jgi:demethylmenaquinone methyltransferase / 2-methoxy-6-polyprenyl-1,4-benzoquinol methylase
MNQNLSGPQPEFIKDLFGSISGSYDKANDVITLGLARTWRKNLVEWSQASEGNRVLDCATGTGDLAIEFKKAVGQTGKVIGIDFCAGMLESAPSKAQKERLDVLFELGDVTALNYPSQEFDITSIAYGIRNVVDPVLALQEMARVTKPDGHVMILETGETETPVVRRLVDFYFEHVVPRLGGWVSGRREAYEYLQDSSRKFPSGEDFVELLRSTDRFSNVEYRRLMGGASYIYCCQVG